jgi:ADP-ribose pyrophosphatase YjhB (NUDIX family)
MHWSNPLPVAVVLVPIVRAQEKVGVLLVRRLIPPHIGEVALPGGFVVTGETWQQGAARELFEETGIEVDPAQMQHVETFSDDQNHLIVFCSSPVVDAKELECFHTNEEVSELIVTNEPVELCFPTHTIQLRKYLMAFAWGRDQG